MAPISSTVLRAAPTCDDPGRGRHELEDLLGIGITIERAAGQTLIVEGDQRTHAFRVLTGAVRLYKALPDGRRQVLDFLVAGECFGLFGADHYAYSVEAVVPSAFARYSRVNLETALRSNPELALRLLEAARTDLEQAHVQMLLLGRKSAEEKVATFLAGR
jgi:CRP/FNR family transcriptional regulator, anaerobic regulatory protein